MKCPACGGPIITSAQRWSARMPIIRVAVAPYCLYELQPGCLRSARRMGAAA